MPGTRWKRLVRFPALGFGAALAVHGSAAPQTPPHRRATPAAFIYVP